MHRKNRSREASANLRTLKTGWYGVGNPFNASIPNTAAAAAHKIVNSNVIGMNGGPAVERPAAHIDGIADHRAVVLEKEARASANDPAAQNDQAEAGVRWNPIASARPSIGKRRERVDAAVSRTLRAACRIEGAVRGCLNSAINP